MNSPPLARRFLRLVAIFFGSLIVLVIVVKFGVSLIGTQSEQVETLNNIAESSFVIWVRFSIYGLIFIFWKPLLLFFSPKLSDKTISSTRRPLIVTIILCELFLVQDVASILFGLFR